MSERPHRIVFEKGDERWVADAADGETLLVVAQRVEAPVHTLCTGVGTCVQCKVEVREGGENLSPVSALEKDRLGNIYHLTGERMACQTRVHGPALLRPLALKLKKNGRARR